jgi:hypothetical protein
MIIMITTLYAKSIDDDPALLGGAADQWMLKGSADFNAIHHGAFGFILCFT